MNKDSQIEEEVKSFFHKLHDYLYGKSEGLTKKSNKIEIHGNLIKDV